MSAWAALPLGMAAGLDLYLTILVVGVAARMGWADALGPSVETLAGAPVLSLALALYLVETAVDRFPGLTLAWDALHLLVRPMAIGLLVVLLARDAGPGQSLLLAVVAGSAALLVHAIRTGWRLLLTFTEARRSTRTLASAVEDVGALALVALLLDRPTAAGMIGGGILVLLLIRARRYLAVFGFGLHLLRARAGVLFSTRGWRPVDPDTLGAGTGGRAGRGQRVARIGPEGPASLETGWLLVEAGEGASFRTSASDAGDPLGGWSGALVRPGLLYDALLREEDGEVQALFLPKDGPAPEAVRAALAERG